jgi:hypothetical protein
MTHRSLRRLLGKLIFTTAATVPANSANAMPPDGHTLAIQLQRAHPLDATRIAATDATAPEPITRRTLADALTWPFPLVGDALILDHLARDPDPEVRLAAARAAHARRDSGGMAVLDALSHDPDPAVREAAILGLHGR